MLGSHVRLSEFEESTLNQWLRTRAVQKLTKNGGQLALVFSENSGIGVATAATVKDKDGNILSKDITDYNDW